MELSEFIANIKTDLKSYDAANLLDDISIQNWVIDELKRFGSNIMDLQDQTVIIKNGQGRLPDNYWHLRLAVRVHTERFENLDGDNEDVRFSRAVSERMERGAKWNTEEEGIEVSEKVIVNRIYVNSNRVDMYYNSPILLKVRRGVTQRKAEYNCINLSNKLSTKSPFDIVINNRTVQTNFPDGVIYLQYYGFMADEEGNIVIPETQHNRLKTYLEYYVKSRIFENLAANGDDKNVGNLLQYFDQKARNEFILAQTEAKFESLNWKETRKKMKNQSRRKMQSFENLFPSI